MLVVSLICSSELLMLQSFWFIKAFCSLQVPEGKQRLVSIHELWYCDSWIRVRTRSARSIPGGTTQSSCSQPATLPESKPFCGSLKRKKPQADLINPDEVPWHCLCLESILNHANMNPDLYAMFLVSPG